MFTVSKKALKKAIDTAWPVITKGSTIPILECFKLSFDACPTLTANDLDKQMVVSINERALPGGQPFEVVVNAKVLKNIVSKLPEGKISISKDNLNGITLEAGRLTAKINGLDPNDFPAMSPLQNTRRFSLPGATLESLFDKTSMAISTEETRYYLGGVYLEVKDKNLIAVATDGHRLAKVTIPAPEGSKAMDGVIVPRLAVHLAQKCAKGVDEVKIETSDVGIIFEFPEVTLQTKVIDGTFPDYSRVIPAPSENFAIFDVETLLETAKRLQSFSSERTQGIKIEVKETGGDGATVSYRSPEMGTVSETLKVALPGESTGMEFGCNSRYLIEILQKVGGDKVSINFVSKREAFLIQGSGDTGTLFVLMPMSV